MTLEYSSTFSRAYKRRIKNNKHLEDQFAEKVKLFAKNPHDPSLRIHKLIGRLNDSWAFKIDYDCRVVLKFLDNDIVLFTDVGTHKQVY